MQGKVPLKAQIRTGEKQSQKGSWFFMAQDCWRQQLLGPVLNNEMAEIVVGGILRSKGALDARPVSLWHKTAGVATLRAPITGPFSA